ANGGDLPHPLATPGGRPPPRMGPPPPPHIPTLLDAFSLVPSLRGGRDATCSYVDGFRYRRPASSNADGRSSRSRKPRPKRPGLRRVKGDARRVLGVRLLRQAASRAARRVRQRCRAAEQRDERAALHSITSSARTRRAVGIVRPSAFAVLRLMANSNFVGCWTGRSAGFSPCRMRSTYPAACRYCSGMSTP